MSRFMVRRLISMVFVLFGISLLVFFISHLSPNDPVRMALGPRATEESVHQLREKLGLDRPLLEQYLRYVSRLIQGDLGDSLLTRRPVRDDLADYLPASLELTAAALLLCIGLGYPLGVLAAHGYGGWFDKIVNSLSVMGVAVPVFWIGIVFQLIFYRNLAWLPAEGRLPPGVALPPAITHSLILDSLLAGNLALFSTAVRHLILPAVTLALPNLSYVVKLVRWRVIETKCDDYVRTARSKGLRERVVLARHVLPNALLPAVTMTGMLTGAMLGGAFLVEIIFNWPGLGFYSYRAIQATDLTPVLTVTLVVAVTYMLANLIVDLLYVLLDPRIRYG
jgi:peptide/nickel transport system permease protein